MRTRLTRYSAGSYGWRNGIRVEREGRGKWCVYYGSGKKAYECGTLYGCKFFLHWNYPDRFSF